MRHGRVSDDNRHRLGIGQPARGRHRQHHVERARRGKAVVERRRRPRAEHSSAGVGLQLPLPRDKRGVVVDRLIDERNDRPLRHRRRRRRLAEGGRHARLAGRVADGVGHRLGVVARRRVDPQRHGVAAGAGEGVAVVRRRRRGHGHARLLDRPGVAGQGRVGVARLVGEGHRRPRVQPQGRRVAAEGRLVHRVIGPADLVPAQIGRGACPAAVVHLERLNRRRQRPGRLPRHGCILARRTGDEVIERLVEVVADIGNEIGVGVVEPARPRAVPAARPQVRQRRLRQTQPADDVAAVDETPRRRLAVGVAPNGKAPAGNGHRHAGAGVAVVDDVVLENAGVVAAQPDRAVGENAAHQGVEPDVQVCLRHGRAAGVVANVDQAVGVDADVVVNETLVGRRQLVDLFVADGVAVAAVRRADVEDRMTLCRIAPVVAEVDVAAVQDVHLHVAVVVRHVVLDDDWRGHRAVGPLADVVALAERVRHNVPLHQPRPLNGAEPQRPTGRVGPRLVAALVRAHPHRRQPARRGHVDLVVEQADVAAEQALVAEIPRRGRDGVDALLQRPVSHAVLDRRAVARRPTNTLAGHALDHNAINRHPGGVNVEDDALPEVTRRIGQHPRRRVVPGRARHGIPVRSQQRRPPVAAQHHALARLGLDDEVGLGDVHALHRRADALAGGHVVVAVFEDDDVRAARRPGRDRRDGLVQRLPRRPARPVAGRIVAGLGHVVGRHYWITSVGSVRTRPACRNSSVSRPSSARRATSW